MGIQPDYVFVSRFPFFIEMVREIGGIEVSNPRAFSDPDLLPSGFAAGRIHLGPYEAMAFARIRHNLARGTSTARPTSSGCCAIQAKVRARAADPASSSGVMSVLAHLRTDLPPTELFRLAQAMARWTRRRSPTASCRAASGARAGASVVLPFTSQARRYGDDARKDATIRRC